MSKIKNVLISIAAVIVGAILIILAFAIPNAAKGKELKLTKRYVACLNKGNYVKAAQMSAEAMMGYLDVDASDYNMSVGDAVSVSLFGGAVSGIDTDSVTSIKLLGLAESDDFDGVEVLGMSGVQTTALVRVTYLDDEGKKATRDYSTTVDFIIINNKYYIE